MAHISPTELPELTPPNPFADVAAAMQGKPSPTKEFELQSINRRLAQAQERRAQGQEHRELADHRLKQFGAISTIAKVFGSIGAHVDPASKDAMALTLAKEAEADGMPVKDPKFFRALMEKPQEMSQFLDSFVQSTQQGKPVIEALRESAKNVTDPETLKLIGDVFKSKLTEKEKQGKAISPSDVDAMIASGGKIVGETIPEGFTLPMAEKFQTEQMKKRQLMVPEAFGQQIKLTQEKQLEQPLPPGVQEKLNVTGKLLDDINTALNNFEPDFVGPFESKRAGLQETFGGTPIVGKAIGGPLSAKEVQFRQGYSGAINAVRHEQFGGALTLPEMAEAKKALGDLGKDTEVTRGALLRLQRIYQNAQTRQTEFATQSRRELKGQPKTEQVKPPPPPGFKPSRK